MTQQKSLAAERLEFESQVADLRGRYYSTQGPAHLKRLDRVPCSPAHIVEHVPQRSAHLHLKQSRSAEGTVEADELGAGRFFCSKGGIRLTSFFQYIV